MSDCGVCIGGFDGDGSCDFFHRENRKARKEHKCCECRKVISPKETYVYDRGKFDGDLFTAKTCANCSEIRSGFTCKFSPPYGSLWEEMTEYVFPHFTQSCFDKLQTPEAKNWLRMQWMKWKGLAA